MREKKKKSSVRLSNVKKKTRKDKPLNIKAISKKKASVITWIIVVAIPLFVLVGTIRMFGVLNQVVEIQEEITVIRSEQRSISTNGETLDITLITHTMNEFVPLFMNVDLSNQDVISERIDDLSQFVSFDILQINNGIDHGLNRQLINYELLSVRSYNTHMLANYRVKYHFDQIDYFDIMANEGIDQIFEIDENVENDEENEEKEEKEEKESEDNHLEVEELMQHQVVLNIPFVMVDGLITVVSTPYFTAEQPALNNDLIFDSLIENDPREELREHRESISLFLPTFFEMYARSDKGELALFMENPILMGDHFNVYSVDVAGARFAQAGSNMMVQVFVTFQDKGVDFFHTVPFTLVLEEQANSWFVLEMHHLFVN